MGTLVVTPLLAKTQTWLINFLTTLHILLSDKSWDSKSKRVVCEPTEYKSNWLENKGCYIIRCEASVSAGTYMRGWKHRNDIIWENGTWNGTWWSIEYGVSDDEWGDVRNYKERNFGQYISYSNTRTWTRHGYTFAWIVVTWLNLAVDLVDVGWNKNNVDFITYLTSDVVREYYMSG